MWNFNMKSGIKSLLHTNFIRLNSSSHSFSRHICVNNNSIRWTVKTLTHLTQSLSWSHNTHSWLVQYGVGEIHKNIYFNVSVIIWKLDHWEWCRVNLYTIICFRFAKCYSSFSLTLLKNKYRFVYTQVNEYIYYRHYKQHIWTCDRINHFCWLREPVDFLSNRYSTGWGAALKILLY